ncbi:MAG: hypothetical protein GXO88_05610 [Chlorobi bacterium]|nr:hypothetical protein [Chlorobiota bacterium]
MKSHAYILLFLAMLLFGIDANAQFDTEFLDTSENKVLYNRTTTYGFVSNNLGYGAQYRSGKRLSIFKTRMWDFSFTYYRALNQIKLQQPYENAKRYIFGKKNDTFFLRGGVSWKRLLNRKPYWGGVEVRFVYGTGISLGIAKPYYLYVIYQTNPGYSPPSYEIVARVYDKDPAKRNWLGEFGRAPFSNGFGEITIHPGAYFKLGLNFEFGKESTKMKV